MFSDNPIKISTFFSDLPDHPDHLLFFARLQLDPPHPRIIPSKETSSLALVNTGNIIEGRLTYTRRGKYHIPSTS